MGDLMTRIDDTREHLFRESGALVKRTRDAGDGLTKAVRDEVRGWQDYLKARRFALERELRDLATPAAVRLATLRAAEELLARAHADVQARVQAAAADVRRARKAAMPKRAAATRKRGKAATRGRKKTLVFPAAAAA